MLMAVSWSPSVALGVLGNVIENAYNYFDGIFNLIIFESKMAIGLKI